MVDGVPTSYAPYLANYHVAANFQGHTVMVIGQATSDYWWVFKTYWDIVLTWYQNFSTDEMTVNFGNTTAIHYVDHQYQTGSYFLCRNNALLTNYN